VHEPYGEAKFEGNRYGDRPGKGGHDAGGIIYRIITPNKRNKWVGDADLKECFDNIAHPFLLDLIGAIPGRELG